MIWLMKNKYSRRIFFLLALYIFSFGLSLKKAAAQQTAEALNFQVFYDALAPFGTWIHEEQYGYVWIPPETDFHPYYTNGYWEMTVYGNTWISLYPWGWAPFHYGRWTYDPFYGWIWIPGYQWAPAWVCWRHGRGYYGWAPLGPGFTIHLDFSSYDCPDNWWVFTPHQYVYGPRHSTHYSRNKDRRRVRASAVIGHTATDAQTHSLYPTGPSAEEIRNASGQVVTIKAIQDVRVADLSLPEGTDIRLYRPAIVRDEKQPGRPARFQPAARPIRENQPVITGRRNISEYRKWEGTIPGRETTREQEKDRVRVAPTTRPPERRSREERQQQKSIPARRPHNEPVVRPTHPEQPSRPARKF